MKRKKFKLAIILGLFLLNSFSLTISINVTYVIAGSPSSGDIPPPSNEDTGGGSAAGGLYLNYRIPLIFKSGPYAPTLIAITAMQNSSIIFGFNSTQYEGNIVDVIMGDTLIIDPTLEPNLINGSLIQSFTPLQITVYHNTSSQNFDDSFAYSVLVMSMWGRKHQSPFDNQRALIVAGFNQTEIDVITPSEEIQYHDIPIVGQTLDIDVEKGTIINANGPIGVVFYSLSLNDGSYAYTSIPAYLWGTEYYISPPSSTDSILLLEGETEIILTTQEEGEFIHSESNLNEDRLVYLPDNGTAQLPNGLLNPSEYFERTYSVYTNYSLSILYNYTYNSTPHLSAIQYIASDKMRWAELFFSSLDYTNEKLRSIILEDESIILPLFLQNNTLWFDIDNSTIKNKGEYFDYMGNESIGFIGNDSFFVFMETFLPEAELWNSSINILYPLNLYSFFDNTSTFFPSWYRFPNINVKEVIPSPAKPTEFRRLQLDIMVQNNGSIPSAPFWVTVYVNDSLKIHRMLDGLDILEVIPITYEEFQGFGLKSLNVSIYTDSKNQIFELYEFDNSIEYFIKISRNWNIIYTSVAIAVLVIGFIGYSIIRRVRKHRRRSKTRFDVILSDIEV
jgi:hypothetical protein